MTRAELLAELKQHEPEESLCPTCFIGAALGTQGIAYRDKHNSMWFIETEDDFGSVPISTVERWGDPTEVADLNQLKWGAAARAEASRCADAHERAMKVLIRLASGIKHDLEK